MPDATINVGVKVDQATIDREFGQIPNKIRDRWNKVNQGVADSGVVMGKAFEERLGGRVQRMQQLAAEASTQGFFTPKARQEYDKASREVNTLWKRYTNERVTLARDSGARLEKEIIDLSEREKKARGKEADDLRRQMARKFKELNDFQATGGSQAAIAKARADAKEMRRAFEEMEDESALVDTKHLPQEPGQPGDRKKSGAAQFLRQFGLQFGRGLLGGTLVAGGGYLLASKLRTDFHDELQRGMAVADLSQRFRPEGMDYGQFRNIVGRLHPSFSPDESTRFFSQYGGLAGTDRLMSRYLVQSGNMIRTEGEPGQGRAAEAASLTRAFGFSPEQGAQFFGQSARLGMTDQGQRKFASLLAEAIAEGRMKGREGEAFESMIRVSETLVSRVGDAGNVQGIAGLMAGLGATGVPGLQGQYGASVLGRVDQALVGTGRNLFQMPDLLRPVALSLMSKLGLRPEALKEKLEGGLADPQFMGAFTEEAQRLYGRDPLLMTEFAQQYGIPLRHRQSVMQTLRNPAALRSLQGLEKLVGKEELSSIPIEQTAKLADLARKVETQGLTKEQATQELAKLRVEDRPEAKVREELAQLHQLEAAVVRKLIPAYEGLLRVTLGTAQALTATGHPTIDTVRRESLAKEAAKTSGVPFSLLREAAKDVSQEQLTPVIPGKRLDEGTLASLSIRGAKHAGLSPALVRSVIEQESRGVPSVVSPAGAEGLMQLMPSSFPGMSEAERKDPTRNVMAGSKYLRDLIDQFGSVEKGLAAYNWGPTNLRRHLKQHGGSDWLATIPSSETRNYVPSVMEKFNQQQGNVTISAEPLVVVHKNEKGETIGTETVPLLVDMPNFNLDYRVASEGSGLNARTNSSALTGP